MAPGETRVALDISAAEAAVALIRDSGRGIPESEMEARWAALVGSPAYAAWASACSLTPDEALAALRRCPPKPHGTIPEVLPPPVRGVLAAFAEGRRHVDELSARLAQAQALRIADAADRALALLPTGTPLQATVYVLLSGDRQGLANGRAEVSLDLLSIPATSAQQLTMPLVAHELHHIGFDWCQVRDRHAQRVLAAGGARAAAAWALRMLLSEGTANAFFTPLDEEWVEAMAPALTDEYGVDFVDTWSQRLKADRCRLPELVHELDSMLALLASGKEIPAAISYVRGITTPRDNLARPVAHFLGEAMVTAIRRQEGDEAAVAAIADLRRFVPAYQDAAEAVGLPRLRDETVASINRLWE